MATLCTLTGVLRDRQNAAVASTEISFAFKNGVVGSGDVYTPVIETTTTDGSGNISIQLVNGSYTGTMLSNGRIETFTLNVPDAASADIGDYIDQDVDQTPALLAQAVAAKDAAEATLSVQIVAVSASRDLALTDARKLLEVSSGSTVTLTVQPDATTEFDVGSVVEIIQVGAGDVTIAAGAGVTISNAYGLTLPDQWAAAKLYKRAADHWVLVS